MSSEIRVNSLTNRSGLSTVSITDTGAVFSGIVTANNFKTGTTNIYPTGVSGGDGVFTGDLSVSGNVSIGGTLTYEDVTNIDSVGIITAQSGIRVSSGSSIGIGTDNPNSSLQVVDGDIRISNVSGITTGIFRRTISNNYQWTGSAENSDIPVGTYGISIDNNDQTTNSTLALAKFSTFKNSSSSNPGIVYIGAVDSGGSTNHSADFIVALKDGSPTVVERARILSTGGLTFNGDTATANALDDYEEGTITNWRLAKTGSTAGSNDSTTEIQYTKIGRCVYISGYIYTANTGSGTDVVAIVNTSDNTTKATLPFVPNHNGALPVLHTRSMTGTWTTYGLSVGFVANNAGVYLYSNNGTGNYVIDENNVVTNTQTHLVITFGGHYFTDS